jgi:lactoylglutathione lyase
MRVNYTIVFTSDMARSVAFYRDVLGIPLRFETSEWSEFVTDGATIALHKSDSAAPEGDSRRAELPGTCRPGLQVADLDTFHQLMAANNVRCEQEPTPTFGVRLAQYVDPDGLIFSVAEAPKQGQ